MSKNRKRLERALRQRWEAWAHALPERLTKLQHELSCEQELLRLSGRIPALNTEQEQLPSLVRRCQAYAECRRQLQSYTATDGRKLPDMARQDSTRLEGTITWSMQRQLILLFLRYRMEVDTDLVLIAQDDQAWRDLLPIRPELAHRCACIRKLPEPLLRQSIQPNPVTGRYGGLP